MNFNTYYEKYKNIIHYLLKSYNISYDYEEFYQLLLIRMWELIERYDEQHQLALNKYLFSRLRFYLIDLFRQRGKEEPALSLETATHTYVSQSLEEQILTAELLKAFLPLLTSHERQWFLLRLQGYQQAEIANQLQRSVSSVKLYRRSVLKKFQQFMAKAEV
ncbi:sigma-70 family RNA polymerase sigma factor [Staphylococcus argensis]|uniref:RNA polymerase sigma factor SigS n=1 Tax=Staphylococcus argensis TaxID=1607738 RepID=A0A2K4FFW9_9STAP|nr:sigma-70 family RNA polymerase sigma factor [Staphylococcus argensis]MCY6990767.1 sigma-70 family RNA polymerase sigma factor [Staphylococcus argensis]POA10270.1 RNA polymerase subunit sigma [Staphylococcus argensis]